jgi:hypothetical protein
MKILRTPWLNEFLGLVENAEESIKITSPFIKKSITNQLIENKQVQTKIELITSFKINSIYNGSLDLNSVDGILNNKGQVKNYSRLHAKIYIFDNQKAIISSGNLTNGGLLSNYEYGVLFEDKEIVNEVVNDFDYLYSGIDGNIEKVHIDEVKRILDKIPKPIHQTLPEYNIDIPEESNDVLEIDLHVIQQTLKGWKRDVFNCLTEINHQQFSLEDIYRYENYLNQLHSENNNIKAKIRQQLQNLRDIGLLEFMGNGNYRKLWK